MTLCLFLLGITIAIIISHIVLLAQGSDKVEKKHKYLKACHDRCATFTVFCVSLDGMLSSEAEIIGKRLGEFLAAKWERPYSVVMGWVRVRLFFSIL